jgi:hypothetical protein
MVKNQKEIILQKLFEEIQQPIKTFGERKAQQRYNNKRGGKFKSKIKVLYINLEGLKFDEQQIFEIENTPLNYPKTNCYTKLINNTTQKFKAKRNGFTH